MENVKIELEKRGIELKSYCQTGDTALVLCKWNDEYVIWTLDTRTCETFWGHYFKNYKDASTFFVNKIEWWHTA